MQLSRRRANQTLNGRAMGAAMARRERVMSAVPDCWSALLPPYEFKVDHHGNLSTVVVDRILTKSKNCGAKAAVIPNITSRAEDVTGSIPPPLLQKPARSDRWRHWALGSTASPALR